MERGHGPIVAVASRHLSGSILLCWFVAAKPSTYCRPEYYLYSLSMFTVSVYTFVVNKRYYTLSIALQLYISTVFGIFSNYRIKRYSQELSFSKCKSIHFIEIPAKSFPLNILFCKLKRQNYACRCEPAIRGNASLWKANYMYTGWPKKVSYYQMIKISY